MDNGKVNIYIGGESTNRNKLFFDRIVKYNFDKNRNIKSMKSGDRQIEFVTELNDDVEFRKSLNRFRKLGVIK